MKIIEDLIKELAATCNRHANGQCTTRRCLERGGGYKPGVPPDYDKATCERHEQVLALHALLQGWRHAPGRMASVGALRASRAELLRLKGHEVYVHNDVSDLHSPEHLIEQALSETLEFKE